MANNVVIDYSDPTYGEGGYLSRRRLLEKDRREGTVSRHGRNYGNGRGWATIDFRPSSKNVKTNVDKKLSIAARGGLEWPMTTHVDRTGLDFAVM
jgi:hypothetical protein